jgi:hypothetical protein
MRILIGHQREHEAVRSEPILFQPRLTEVLNNFRISKVEGMEENVQSFSPL